MNWSGSTALIAVEPPKRKRSLLPVLTVLFLISYGLMTLLIVEQGATIQSQSNLIKVLLPESRELWGIRSKAIAAGQAAKTQDQKHGQVPAAQTPSTQAPSAGQQPHTESRSGEAAKPNVQFPPIPASELDPRRTVRRI